jgi:hypothetical protein
MSIFASVYSKDGKIKTESIDCSNINVEGNITGNSITNLDNSINALQNDLYIVKNKTYSIRYTENSTWGQLKDQDSDLDGNTGDNAGRSVALSSDGTIVAVGAHGYDGYKGTVRVYQWDGSTWIRRGTEGDLDGEAGDWAGVSVALSSDGTIVAVGAEFHDSSKGTVRVYQWNGSTWIRRGSDLDGVDGDQAGTSVALSSDGTIVAVGAQMHDSSKGTVRVYQWNGSTWIRRGTEGDLDGLTGDQAGRSVALSSDGTIVAVGAYGYDGYKGTVRVYQWDGSTWIRRGTEGDLDGVDYAGISVDLSSDGAIVAVGANNHDNYKGTVRVYQWDDSTWIRRGSDLDGVDGGDYAGTSVALSSGGTIVAVGAYNHDSGKGTARVYQWNGSTWDMLGTEGNLDGVDGGDQAGISVALSSDGTIVSVGTQSHDSSKGTVRVYHITGTDASFNNIDIGHNLNVDGKSIFASDISGTDASFNNIDIGHNLNVNGKSIFEIVGNIGTQDNSINALQTDLYIVKNKTYNMRYTVSSTWEQLKEYDFDLDGLTGDQAGRSVALSSEGTIVAVGAEMHDSGKGIVRVYQWDGSTWIRRGTDDDLDGVDGDRAGRSVALSSDGTIVAVGADNHDSGKGIVRVYQWDGSTWIRRGGDLDGLTGDKAGTSVALSSNGTIVAVGAQLYDSGKGIVRVYQWNGSTWIRRGTESDLDGNAGDNAGTSVALSSDGTIVAVGAINHDNYKGTVRVYQWNGSTWDNIGGDLDGVDGDNAGYSVALSSDGTIVAVGAIYHDNYKGTVRVYQWNGSTWIRRGTESDLDGNAGDFAGTSVALSSDGTIVAVGASGHDSGKGTVRVYKWEDSTWIRRGGDLDGVDGDNAGISVALNSVGTVVAVGAYRHIIFNINDIKGTARVYNITRADANFNNIDIGHNLNVNGKSIFASDISCTDASFNNIDIGHNLNVDGKSIFASDISGAYASFNNIDIDHNLNVEGNVSIGTSTMNNELDVYGSAYVKDKVGIGTSTMNNELDVYGSAYVKDKVGIGTTSPDVPLHVKSNDNTPIAIFEGESDTVVLVKSNSSSEYDDVGYMIKGKSSVNQYWFIGTDDNTSELCFSTSNDFNISDNEHKMCLTETGRLGIGTRTPSHPLEVVGYVLSADFGANEATFWADNSSGDWNDDGNGTSNNPMSIKASNGILAMVGFWTQSDKRIKKNIVEIDDDLSLQKLRDISCCSYKYIDTLGRGNNTQIGFIAQQVREHLPNAISIQKIIIPNEMKRLENTTWNETKMSSNDLQDVSGIKYRFYVNNDVSGNEKMVELVGDENNCFTFKEKWENVFCYGKEVDDFHTLDKQKLFALNFSATQEIDRIQQKQLLDISQNTINTQLNKTEINLLKHENEELKTELNIIKLQNQTLQNRFEAIEKRLYDANI